MEKFNNIFGDLDEIKKRMNLLESGFGDDDEWKDEDEDDNELDSLLGGDDSESSEESPLGLSEKQAPTAEIKKSEPHQRFANVVDKTEQENERDFRGISGKVNNLQKSTDLLNFKGVNESNIDVIEDLVKVLSSVDYKSIVTQMNPAKFAITDSSDDIVSKLLAVVHFNGFMNISVRSEGSNLLGILSKAIEVDSIVNQVGVKSDVIANALKSIEPSKISELNKTLPTWIGSKVTESPVVTKIEQLTSQLSDQGNFRKSVANACYKFITDSLKKYGFNSVADLSSDFYRNNYKAVILGGLSQSSIERGESTQVTGSELHGSADEVGNIARRHTKEALEKAVADSDIAESISYTYGESLKEYIKLKLNGEASTHVKNKLASAVAQGKKTILTEQQKQTAIDAIKPVLDQSIEKYNEFKKAKLSIAYKPKEAALLDQLKSAVQAEDFKKALQIYRQCIILKQGESLDLLSLLNKYKMLTRKVVWEHLYTAILRASVEGKKVNGSDNKVSPLFFTKVLINSLQNKPVTSVINSLSGNKLNSDQINKIINQILTSSVNFGASSVKEEELSKSIDSLAMMLSTQVSSGEKIKSAESTILADVMSRIDYEIQQHKEFDNASDENAIDDIYNSVLGSSVIENKLIDAITSTIYKRHVVDRTNVSNVVASSIEGFNDTVNKQSASGKIEFIERLKSAVDQNNVSEDFASFVNELIASGVEPSKLSNTKQLDAEYQNAQSDDDKFKVMAASSLAPLFRFAGKYKSVFDQAKDMVIYDQLVNSINTESTFFKSFKSSISNFIQDEEEMKLIYLYAIFAYSQTKNADQMLVDAYYSTIGVDKDDVVTMFSTLLSDNMKSGVAKNVLENDDNLFPIYRGQIVKYLNSINYKADKINEIQSVSSIQELKDELVKIITGSSIKESSKNTLNGFLDKINDVIEKSSVRKSETALDDTTNSFKNSVLDLIKSEDEGKISAFVAKVIKVLSGVSVNFNSVTYGAFKDAEKFKAVLGYFNSDLSEGVYSNIDKSVLDKVIATMNAFAEYHNIPETSSELKAINKDAIINSVSEFNSALYDASIKLRSLLSRANIESADAFKSFLVKRLKSSFDEIGVDIDELSSGKIVLTYLNNNMSEPEIEKVVTAIKPALKYGNDISDLVITSTTGNVKDVNLDKLQELYGESIKSKDVAKSFNMAYRYLSFMKVKKSELTSELQSVVNSVVELSKYFKQSDALTTKVNTLKEMLNVNGEEVETQKVSNVVTESIEKAYKKYMPEQYFKINLI